MQCSIMAHATSNSRPTATITYDLFHFKHCNSARDKYSEKTNSESYISFFVGQQDKSERKIDQSTKKTITF